MAIDYYENGVLIQIEEDDPRNPANEISLEESSLSDDKILELKSESQRQNRNSLIAESDWMACSDVTMSDAWKTYRQALRDLPTHSNWPHLDDADWPTKPTG